MNALTACPDVSRYQELLSGSLPPNEVELLAGHLEECPGCAQTVANLGNDTLSDALHSALAASSGAETKQVERVIEQCLSAVTQASAEAATETGARSTDSEVPEADAVENELAFLAPPQAADEIGRLDGYRILKLLGQGGMGMVFEAEDIRLLRRVALKVMKPEIAAVAKHRQRFLREARAAAKVEHDHIVPIYQVGEENGVPFIAMPFLKGYALDALLKRGRLNVADILMIASQVADGLAAAHAQGLIHRDIKPGNIWCEEKRRAKILDFGLARLSQDDAHLTQSGAIMGTPAYMAPEQARGESVDHRADLFSLGCVLYEMSTGRRPFRGESTMAVLTSLAVDRPPSPRSLNPELPSALSKLIEQLLEKEADKRPASAAKVVETLRKLQMSSAVVVLATPMAAPDPWADIDDVTEPAPATVMPVRRDAKPVNRGAEPLRSGARRPERSGSKFKIMIAAALLIMIGGGFAAYKLIFETKDGTLVVEVDGDADVRFKNGELLIYGEDGKLKYTLKPGQRDKKMPPGTYTVQVVSADGVKLNSDKFEMSKDGKVILRVTVDATVVAKKEAKVDLTKDPDRRAAEWALSIGGTIDIKGEADSIKITRVSELPANKFRIMQIDLQANKQVNDESLMNLRGSSVGTLYLMGTSITDRGMPYIASLSNLGNLVLNDTDISDAGLLHLKGLVKLSNLEAGHTSTKITDAGFAHLAEMRQLKTLKFTGPISERGLNQIKHLPIESLYLVDSAITDAGLAMLGEMLQLRQLDVTAAKITDNGLKHLRSLSKLTWLELQNTPIGDAGLAHLKSLKSLGALGLFRTKVSDAGIASLKEMSSLYGTKLNSTNVTYAGLSQLADMPGLRQLYVMELKLTKAEVEKLAAAMPQCMIESDHGRYEPKSPHERVRPLIATLLKAGVVVSADPNKGVFLKSEQDFTAKDRLQWIQIHATDERNPLADPAVLTAISRIPPEIWSRNADLVDVSGPITEEQFKGLIEALANQPITMFGIHSSPFKDAALAHLARLPNLSFVSLTHTPGITDEGLKHVAAIPKLNWLILIGGGKSGFTGAGLAHLRGRQLDSLVLRFVEGLDDASIMQLAGTPTLKHLEVLGGKLTADGVKKFAAAMPRCKIVWPGGTIEPKPLSEIIRPAVAAVLKNGGRVAVVAGEQVRELKTAEDLKPDDLLQNVQLNFAAMGQHSLGDPASFESILLLPTAAWGGENRFLLLSNPISVEQFRALMESPGMRGVTHLSMINTRLPESALASLAQLPLSSLELSNGIDVSDEGIKKIAKFPDLVFLSLAPSKVTGAGLAPLRGQRLTSLNLADCAQIDDAAIEHLSAMSTLTALNVKRTKMTADGVKKLAAAFPTCQIESDHGTFEPKQAADPERRAAEWVLKLGGTVTMSAVGYPTVKAVEKLPNGPFRIISIDLSPTNGAEVNDALFDNLAHLSELHSLDLMDGAITDDVVARLATLRSLANLTKLGLKGSRVTDASLVHVTKFKKLIVLSLLDTGITNEGMKRLREMPTLTGLVLGGTKITDDGLAEVAGLKLNGLFLNPTITDAGLQHVKGLTDLLELGIANTGVSDAGMPVVANFRKLKQLYLSKNVTDNGLSKLQDLTQLEVFYLNESKVTDAGIKHLARMVRLKNLQLSGTAITDAAIDDLKGLASIQRIAVVRTKMTADGVKKLAVALPQCRIESDHGTFEPKVVVDPDRKAAEYVLSIGGSVRVNQEAGDIKVAEDLPREVFRLTDVSFYQNQQVNDAGLACLKDCKGLTHLDLTGTHVSDAGLVHFRDCKNLLYLTLSRTKLGDAGMVNFKDSKNLRYLFLDQTQVTDVGLANFNACKDLIDLRLGHTTVTDAGIAHFKDCKGLTTLYLYGTQVSDAGLAQFEDCKDLVRLALSSKVTDAGLAHFKKCKNLTNLDLNDTQVTDVGLVPFKDCKNLTHLHLQGTQVSDAGVSHFKECKYLKFLDVGKTKATAKGIDEFKKALPQCKIEWDGGVIKPQASAEANRKVAEWVLRSGGKVRVRVGKELQRVPTDLNALPNGPFELITLELGAATTDDDLQNLEGVSGVPEIALINCRSITDRGLERLAAIRGLSSLSWLSLEQAKISDEGLMHLRNFGRLTTLYLTSTAVTDAGIAKLTELNQLEYVQVFATKVTEAAAKKFVTVLPRCQVRWSGGTIHPTAVWSDEKPPPKDLVPGGLAAYEMFDDPKVTRLPIGESEGIRFSVNAGVYSLTRPAAKAKDSVWSECPGRAEDLAFAIRLRTIGQSTAVIGLGPREAVATGYAWGGFTLDATGVAEFRSMNAASVRQLSTPRPLSSKADPALAAGKWVTLSGRRVGATYEIWANDNFLGRIRDGDSSTGESIRLLDIGVLATADGPVQVDVDWLAVWNLPKAKRGNE